ncbi:hypothetical protein ES703_05239 [subsurface metagenome]
MKFWDARSAGEGARKLKEIYDGIISRAEYSDLPKWTKKEDAKENLEHWEQSHAAVCKRRRDDGQFFGFKEVGEARLERYTRFIPIPAVQEFSDEAVEGRRSLITELMDLVVRNALEEEKINKVREGLGKGYQEQIIPMVSDRMLNLQKSLSDTLRTYVPTSNVWMDWKPTEFNLPIPEVELKLDEDGFKSAVERCGHGLQRIFYLTLVQQLTKSQVQEGENEVEKSDNLPGLILAIEEPELYQHPARQRYITKKFLDLTTQGKIPGVASQAQIIYATHSPLFVGIDRFDQIRRFQKIEPEDEGGPKVTQIKSIKRQEFLEELRGIRQDEGKYEWLPFIARLRCIMTPQINEGFFADVAVLVEGEEDKAAIEAAALLIGYDLSSLNIAVLPCGGKSNLDRPTLIFRHLGIQTYTIWDNDYGKSEKNARPEVNQQLLRLVDYPTEEKYPDKIGPNFACFKTELKVVLRQELGEKIYDEILNDLVENEYKLQGRSDACKNPFVMRDLLERIEKEQGVTSSSLINIVKAIVRLAQEPM